MEVAPFHRFGVGKIEFGSLCCEWNEVCKAPELLQPSVKFRRNTLTVPGAAPPQAG
jgi:hypothetical protein